MGLDFARQTIVYWDHNQRAHWSYSGFNHFRARLAALIGIDLDTMAGFRTDGEPHTTWDGINDPIVLLLNHSDCDGELTPAQCREVAPRLRDLVADWPEDDYDRHHALLLASHMDECDVNDEVLVFC